MRKRKPFGRWNGSHEQELEKNEQMDTLLTHKHAVIFGAGGAVGTAVIRINLREASEQKASWK